MAVTNLKRQANKKSEGSLAYVKGGLSTFFEAQDALSGKASLRAICWGFHCGNLTLCPLVFMGCDIWSVFIKVEV
jgi:hypothetical protein